MGFKQISGQHYNGTSISLPVTNAMTIRIAMTIMLMQSGIAHVVDVKGAFLYGEFKYGEKVYIKIPLGFEGFYPRDTVFLLKKTLYRPKKPAEDRKALSSEDQTILRSGIGKLMCHMQNSPSRYCASCERPSKAHDTWRQDTHTSHVEVNAVSEVH